MNPRILTAEEGGLHEATQDAIGNGDHDLVQELHGMSAVYRPPEWLWESERELEDERRHQEQQDFDDEFERDELREWR